jgi:hypothetical protein
VKSVSLIRKVLFSLFLLVCSQTTITSKDDSKRKSCKRGNAADCAPTTSKDDREINSCERGGGGGEECGTTRNLFLITTPLPTASTPDFRSEVLRVLIFQKSKFFLETAICEREVHVWSLLLRFIPFRGGGGCGLVHVDPPLAWNVHRVNLSSIFTLTDTNLL